MKHLFLVLSLIFAPCSLLHAMQEDLPTSNSLEIGCSNDQVELFCDRLLADVTLESLDKQFSRLTTELSKLGTFRAGVTYFLLDLMQDKVKNNINSNQWLKDAWQKKDLSEPERNFAFLLSLRAWNNFLSFHNNNLSKEIQIQGCYRFLTSQTVQRFRLTELHPALVIHITDQARGKNRLLFRDELGLDFVMRRQAVLQDSGGLRKLLLIDKLKSHTYFLNDFHHADDIDVLIQNIRDCIDPELFKYSGIISTMIELIATAYLQVDNLTSIEYKKVIKEIISSFNLELLGIYEQSLGESVETTSSYLNCFLCCIYFHSRFYDPYVRPGFILNRRDLCLQIIESTTYKQLPESMQQTVNNFMIACSINNPLIKAIVKSQKITWMQFIKNHPSIIYPIKFGLGLVQGFAINKLFDRIYHSSQEQISRIASKVSTGVAGGLCTQLIIDKIIPQWLLKNVESKKYSNFYQFGTFGLGCILGAYVQTLLQSKTI